MLDIEQVVIRGRLVLGLLLSTDGATSEARDAATRAVQSAAAELELSAT